MVKIDIQITEKGVLRKVGEMHIKNTTKPFSLHVGNYRCDFLGAEGDIIRTQVVKDFKRNRGFWQLMKDCLAFAPGIGSKEVKLARQDEKLRRLYAEETGGKENEGIF